MNEFTPGDLVRLRTERFSPIERTLFPNGDALYVGSVKGDYLNIAHTQQWWHFDRFEPVATTAGEPEVAQ